MEFLQLADVDACLHFLDVLYLEQEALHDVGFSTQLRVQRLQDALDDEEHELGLDLHVLLGLLQPVIRRVSSVSTVLVGVAQCALLHHRVVQVLVLVVLIEGGRSVAQIHLGVAFFDHLRDLTLELVVKRLAVDDCTVFDVFKLLIALPSDILVARVLIARVERMHCLVVGLLVVFGKLDSLEAVRDEVLDAPV